MKKKEKKLAQKKSYHTNKITHNNCRSRKNALTAVRWRREIIRGLLTKKIYTDEKNNSICSLVLLKGNYVLHSNLRSLIMYCCSPWFIRLIDVKLVNELLRCASAFKKVCIPSTTSACTFAQSGIQEVH